MKPKEYTYRGVVKLVENPYQEDQLDERSESRKVWMFPIRPLAGAPIVAKEDFIAKKIQQEIEMSKLTLEELRLKAILYSTDNPGTQKVVTTEYIRNTYVSEYAKRVANGTCQFCGKLAPFKDKNQLDYLETHHIIWLSNGGKDALENVVALCPNCHRKMHIINDPNDVQILIDKALINLKPKWIS